MANKGNKKKVKKRVFKFYRFRVIECLYNEGVDKMILLNVRGFENYVDLIDYLSQFDELKKILKTAKILPFYSYKSTSARIIYTPMGN